VGAENSLSPAPSLARSPDDFLTVTRASGLFLPQLSPQGVARGASGIRARFDLPGRAREERSAAEQLDRFGALPGSAGRAGRTRSLYRNPLMESLYGSRARATIRSRRTSQPMAGEVRQTPTNLPTWNWIAGETDFGIQTRVRVRSLPLTLRVA